MIANTETKVNFRTLQLIRGLAAILIVLFHGFGSTGILAITKYGIIGVDLFFVLSGFIIFYVHYADIGLKSKFKPYVVKRFLRIFPLYWMVTIIYIMLITPFKHSFSVEHIIKSILLMPHQTLPIVGVAWTLEYEILFYLLFGLMILNRKVFYPAFLIWFFTIIFFFISPSLEPDYLMVGKIFNPINLEFLAGCGVGILITKNILNFKWIPRVCISAGIIGICISVIINYFGIWEFHRAIGWGIPSAVLIFGLVKLELSQKIRIPQIFVYLGNSSYSIYLTHLITLLIFSKIIEKIGIFFNPAVVGMFYAVSCILSVVLGCAAHSLFEKPIMNYFKQNIIKMNKPSLNHSELKSSV